VPEAPENVPAQARLHIGTSKKCGGNNRSQVVSQDEPSEFGMAPGQQTIDVREASGQMREHQETRDSIEAGTLCESSACKQSQHPCRCMSTTSMPRSELHVAWKHVDRLHPTREAIFVVDDNYTRSESLCLRRIREEPVRESLSAPHAPPR